MVLITADALHGLSGLNMQPALQQLHVASSGLQACSMGPQYTVMRPQVLVDTPNVSLPGQALMQPAIMQQQQPSVCMNISAPQAMFAGSMLAGQQLMDPNFNLSCATPMTPMMMPQSAPPEHRSVFFAGVTPIVPSETLMALFSQFGPVASINLFKPWAGSKTSKGCGIVVFVDRQSAAAAMEALNGIFQWPGARSPMVVEWMDANKQHKKARAKPLAYSSMQRPQHYLAFQPITRMLPGNLWNNSFTQQLLV